MGKNATAEADCAHQTVDIPTVHKAQKYCYHLQSNAMVLISTESLI